MHSLIPLQTAFSPMDRLYQEYENGLNMVHVRPALPPRDQLLAYLDTVDQLGMWFTFDMSDSEELREKIEAN